MSFDRMSSYHLYNKPVKCSLKSFNWDYSYMHIYIIFSVYSRWATAII